MADVVNLNKFRKAKKRAEKEKRAEANRVEFGAPKALKELEAAKKDLANKALSGKKLSDDDGDDQDGA